VLIGTALLLLGACVAPVSRDYPERYAEALAKAPSAPPPADAITRFAELYARLHEAGFEERARAFYAPSLYFNDTLTTLATHDELVAHLRGMHEAGTRLSITIDDVIDKGPDLYVRWTMVATFDALGSRTSRTIGISHLRFAPDGRCALQQDFWDPALGFYRNVPVVGSILERIRRRFDPEGS
jgi:hypothetical protein